VVPILRVVRPGHFVLKALYWLAVLAISLALVVGLILFFESRDQSSVDDAAVPSLVTSRA
jgi:cytochrome b subunit of formate dehydrogenase